MSIEDHIDVCHEIPQDFMTEEDLAKAKVRRNKRISTTTKIRVGSFVGGFVVGYVAVKIIKNKMEEE